MENKAMDDKSLVRSLELCRKVTQDIIDQLIELKVEVTKHRRNVLVAKTSGTTVATLGTGLAVAGLIMAPFTFGASLIVSSVGAATSVSGAAANLITDLVDRSKKNKYIANIQDLSKEQQTAKTDLIFDLERFSEVFETLLIKGLTTSQAIYATINGDHCAIYESEKENHPEEFEWVDAPSENWKPIRKFCFKAGFGSLKVMKNTKTLATIATSGKDIATISGIGGTGGVAIFNSGTRAATTGAATTGSVATGIGRFLGSTAFRGTMAAVGVVFTTIDIAILVKQWRETDPSEETIDVVIQEFTDEVQQYEEFLQEIDKCKNCKMFAGWIDENVPIIGTSPFTVEMLLKTFLGDGDTAQNLYREIYPEFHEIIPSEPSGFIEFILQNDDVLCGDLTLNDIKELLASTSAVDDLLDSKSLDKRNAETDEIETYYSNQTISVNGEEHNEKEANTDTDNFKRNAKIITDIAEIFKGRRLKDSTKVNVFDLSILKLNQYIINSCLEELKLPSFPELRTNLLNTAIMSDFDNTLNENTTNLIENVVVAYNKYDGSYLNANKWEYNLVLGFLKRYATSYFMEEYQRNRDVNIYDDFKESDLLEPFQELIEILVNHKCFVDPIAEAIWMQNDNNEKRRLFENLLELVSDMLRSLKFRIPVWACELQNLHELD